MSIRKRIFEILEKPSDDDILGRFVDLFIIMLIITNVIAIILESFVGFALHYGRQLKLFEIVSVAIFTFEFVLRVITSDLKYPSKNFISSVLKYLTSFSAIIDILAILPFYLPFFITCDLRFMRVLRLTRILRVLKIQRYNSSIEIIGEVLKRKKYDLAVTIFITFLLLLVSAAFMYNVENEVQPEQFPNVIASFWWAIATLTTVGYGDVYPVTVLGKLLSGIIALLGIGIVALPTGIISSGFIEIMEENRLDGNSSKKRFCPYCGNKIEE